MANCHHVDLYVTDISGLSGIFDRCRECLEYWPARSGWRWTWQFIGSCPCAGADLDHFDDDELWEWTEVPV